MSQMLKSSGAMAIATLASRVLGLVREMFYASFMGTTWQASAFVLAFQVPNLFRRLLGEGALTAAFIPAFKKKELQGKPAMWRSANAVLSGLLLFAGSISIVASVIILATLHGLGHPPERRLMLQLLCYMFPYMVLACTAAVLIGMANALGHFFIPALGAAMLNVVMIASVLFLAPLLGVTLERQIVALAIGVVFAGLVQILFQLPTLFKEGYSIQWVNPWHDPDVRDVVRKMIPGSIGVAAFQLNVLVTQAFSFWIDESVVSTFNYAVRLMEFPQGMFGISLATYLLPTLSGMAGRKDYPEFRATLRTGLSHLAFANLFAAAVAAGLATPIVRLLFERGLFGAESTSKVALTLVCLAPGLLMFSTNNILARAFYALDDIKTPMRISVFCLGVNLVLSILAVQHFREAGLAVANTATASLNSGLLLYALRRKLKSLELRPLGGYLVKLAVSAAAAATSAWGVSRLWEMHIGHASLILKIGAVLIPGVAAGAAYLLAAGLLGVPAVKDATRALLRSRKSPTTPV